MADNVTPPGSISWTDLTVDDAELVREFYEGVVGWRSAPVKMRDYSDYCMKTPDTDQTVAGICHARGVNAELPPQWLIYIVVADLQESLDRCDALGGKVLHRRKDSDGNGELAVIQDPAGAVAALFQPPGGDK